MEEFFLNPLFLSEELDVVHQEQVGCPVFLAELFLGLVLDGIDEVVDKSLTLNVDDLGIRVLSQHLVADGLHQVGLTQPHAPKDE